MLPSVGLRGRLAVGLDRLMNPTGWAGVRVGYPCTLIATAPAALPDVPSNSKQVRLAGRRAAHGPDAADRLASAGLGWRSFWNQSPLRHVSSLKQVPSASCRCEPASRADLGGDTGSGLRVGQIGSSGPVRFHAGPPACSGSGAPAMRGRRHNELAVALASDDPATPLSRPAIGN